MRNYLEFEKEIKSLEEDLDQSKNPFDKEGISEVVFTRSTKLLVTPAIAETTTITLLLLFTSFLTLKANFFICGTSATDVPPNFNTTSFKFLLSL